MEFTVPDGRRYAESHEWADRRDGTVRVGITDFAQDELGDVVFVELPAVGEALNEGESFGVVESIKAVSDIYAPVAGDVVDVNEAVVDQPELLNEAPFEDGWLVEIETDGDLDHLLDSSAYRDQIR